MVDYRYQFFEPRGWIFLLRTVFIGHWKDIPCPTELRDQLVLIAHGTTISALVVSTAGLLCEQTAHHFDWPTAALSIGIGSALPFIVLSDSKYGFFALGIVGNIALGVVGGVIGGTIDGRAGGMTASIVIAIAFGVGRGLAFSAIFSVVFGAAGSLAFDLTLNSIPKIQNLITGSLEPLLVFGMASITGALCFASGFLLAATCTYPFDLWRPPDPLYEWSLVFFLLVSILPLSFILALDIVRSETPLWQISGNLPQGREELSPIVFASLLLAFTARLPLWPLEIIWCKLHQRKMNHHKDSTSEDFANQIRKAYFDPQMFLPLPDESEALRKLAVIDEQLAMREATILAWRSNHHLSATLALRSLATSNPLLAEAYLNRNLLGTTRKRYLKYLAHILPEVPAHVLTTSQRLVNLSRSWSPEARELDSLTQIVSELSGIVSDFEDASRQQPDLRHVDTHHDLYRGLLTALETKSIGDMARVKMAPLPTNLPELYPDALREALPQIDSLADRARGSLQATSTVTRIGHLLEALEALTDVESAVDKVPRPAGALLALLMIHWRPLLADAASDLSRGQAAGPFPQPYVFANPVVGAGFVGRADILRRLEELWAVQGQRPSVVLYGHRRIGKSSILQNLSDERFGSDTRIIDFNLQTFGLVPSTGALLHNLALELYDACPSAAAVLAEPTEADFDHEPYGAFRRFLRRLDRHRNGLRLIVTMDEFETLELRIRDGKLQEDLIAYFRGVINTQVWLTLAFAGLHTLREMTEDYWHPLFGSVETIPVSFLSAGTTKRLLTAPTPDFAIDYSEEAIELVYDLAHGQPYLTQLIGHSLVSRLNQQMFEQQIEREPRFDLADVEAVIAADAFYRTGSAYFQGIWAQAAQEPPGQQAVLRALAAGPASRQEIASVTALEDSTLDDAIDCLERHDIITAVGDGDDRRWCCIVELMRLWLEQQSH